MFPNIPAGNYTLETAINSSASESHTVLEFSPVYAYSYPMTYQVQTPVQLSWHQAVTLSDVQDTTTTLTNANVDADFQMVEAPGDVTLVNWRR